MPAVHTDEWFTLTKVDEAEELKQGDLLPECPVVVPTIEMVPGMEGDSDEQLTAEVEIVRTDAVILSQTCDMVKGREKLRTIILCGVTRLEDIKRNPAHLLNKSGKLEEVRKGRYPYLCMINGSKLCIPRRGCSLIDFTEIYSLPIEIVRELAKRRLGRLRLISPYREHVSQAFAAYFSRVALPVDIPRLK